MPSKSIHVAANGKISFFFMVELYSIVHVYHFFFIHSHIDEHLGCFHILSIVNNAAMNIGVHVSFQINVFVFSDICPRVEFLGHMVAVFLVFWEISILFSTVAAPIYIPTSSAQEFAFHQHLLFVFFDDSRSGKCEVISHCGFDLHFPDD